MKKGVEVVDIDSNGVASESGLQKGDVITMIDNQAVESIDDFETIADSLKEGRSVAMLVQRSSGPVFLAIRPEDS